MRLVCTLQDQKYAQIFSNFLVHEGIENQLEIESNSDWGSPDYGTVTCKVWVHSEDDLEPALEWAAIFLENPNDPKFQKDEPRKLSLYDKPPVMPEVEIHDVEGSEKKEPSAILTLYFLIGCTLFFMLGQFTSPSTRDMVKTLPSVSLYSSPIYKDMYYDYPHAYEIVDELVKTFGLERLHDLNELPPEGQALIQKFRETPHWQGIYDQLVVHFRDPQIPWNFAAPMFEKIREGEVWRLITPILLHADIFHLLFNMILLIVLGKQLELRMGRYRYLLFVVLSAIFSNTAQYLMDGPNFLGFSGVLCAMVAFIYVRQKIAAWEGYQLQRSSILFIAIFVFTLAAMQITSFFTEVYFSEAFSPGAANTAHLTGALAGLIFGYTNFFAWQAK